MSDVLLLLAAGLLSAAACFTVGYMKGLQHAALNAQAAAKIAVQAEQLRCVESLAEEHARVDRVFERAGLSPLPRKQMLWKNN